MGEHCRYQLKFRTTVSLGQDRRGKVLGSEPSHKDASFPTLILLSVEDNLTSANSFKVVECFLS